MDTKTDDRLTLLQGDVELDASLLSALDELGDAPAASDRPDHWVPPTQRRLSSAPPMSLTTDLPIRGVTSEPAAAPVANTRYRMPTRTAEATATAAVATAAPRAEVSYEQVRQEGLEWLRDLARRKA